jgi:hypothetical protein
MTMKALNRKLIGSLALVFAAGLAAPAHGAASFDPTQQPYGSLPPLALTGFNLSTGNQSVYQGWFDANTWYGDLVSYPIDSSGHTNTANVLWSAAKVMDSKQGCGTATDLPTASVSYYNTGRIIATRNGTTNVAFRWANLSAAQQASIGTATTGPDILNYVRGDRSKEMYQEVDAGDPWLNPPTNTIANPNYIQYSCGSSTGTMRARSSLIGDVIHARPIYVGAPPANYTFDSYPAFQSSNASRPPRVYLGANDGMVHAFDAANGNEVWAYVPSMLIANLNKLTAYPYTHTYFIDGGMTVSDVNFGTTASPDWHTVLVGGLGAGGKGLYALDITNATAANESAAAAKILWEITPASTGFGDLGYTYGDPVIARLNTGQWAVIAGNGYNNGGTGHAVLYVINIQTGALIKSLDTGAGTAASPDGLSAPLSVDTDFNFTADVVYAGDIDGKMWKFNIGASTASSWTAPTAPLYATGLSIVGAPDVAAHPSGGYLVYFGTGRLFTAADATDATTQNYAYGIWDGAPAANTAILTQTLTEESYSGLRARVSSALPITWSSSTTTPNIGWRTALPLGERVLGTGFVRDARYQFASVNPTIAQTQPPDGENWLNELDYLTGGVGSKLIFDLNSDKLLDNLDRLPNGDGTSTPNGTGIAVSIYEGPGLLSQPVLAILSSTLSTTIFNNNPFFSPDDTPFTPLPADVGLTGGHFDVDIYDATTNIKHVHMYSDVYDVTGVNFLNASAPIFNIGTVIPGATTQFKILIGNQKMSPAVKFSFGGAPYLPVTQLETTNGLTVASLPTYTPASVTSLKYNMPKDALFAKDWSGTGDVRAGLMPTSTGCVHGMPSGTIGPAPNFLYRNGALVWQLIKPGTPDSAIQKVDALGNPAYGYRVKDSQRSTYLLGEWSTFWHSSSTCMGDAGWVKDPAPPSTYSHGTQAPRAPGSADPPWGDLGSVVSTTVTTVADPLCSGCTMITTTTVYATGYTLINVQHLDAKGNVKSITDTLVPPPSGVGGTATTAAGVSQALTASNVVTGFQQSRNSGKLGRVTWHELFGQ